jgi:ring-1,2-phenylacetyl-CoA epoxidase subunit PaaC
VSASSDAAVTTVPDALRPAFTEHLLRLADDRLVLGHRTSEWCGHGPILEEDIALANIALDLIGQATLMYRVASEVAGDGRDEDALAFLRNEREYRNILMAELPRGDFGFTVMRQFFFGVYSVLHLEALSKSKHQDLAGIAAKGLKESRYHVRHCGEWVIRLGDGTEESRARAQAALDELWRYTGEMFLTDELDEAVIGEGLGADPRQLEEEWRRQVSGVLQRATLTIPETKWMQRGGRQGRHTEHLGHMLAEMQVLQRTFPGVSW